MSFLLALTLSFSSEPRSSKSAATNSCRTSTGWATYQISHFQAVVTGTDAVNARVRKALDLPYVRTSPAVELISDEKQCAKAVTALQKHYADGRSHSPVFLIRIGTTRFGIADGALLVHVFDSNFHDKSSIRELN